MAHKKGQGSTRNGRDSRPKYMGIKKYAGEFVTIGSIIVRQNGTKFKPGKNVGLARNDSLFALAEGTVKVLNYKISIEPSVIKDATAAATTKAPAAKAPAAKKTSSN